MAFLGIKIPQEIARVLSQTKDVPGERVPISEMHITILDFGEDWPITELSKAVEATFEIVSKTKPFNAHINKITHFSSSDKIPIISPVKSDKLHELRDELVKKFDNEKIEFSKLHPNYKPHITVSYDDKAPDDIDLGKLSFCVSELILWGGDHGDDRIFVTFPLHEELKKTKSAILLQQADLFEKIAHNPVQKFFSHSYERRKIERA